MREIKKIIIHCSASPDSGDIGVDEIREWHLERDFDDVGYHIVIKRNGDIQMGRPLEKEGAHAKGYNPDSIGICLVGTNSFTDKQICSLRQAILGLMAIFNDLRINDIIAHYQVNKNKTCPNINIHLIRAFVMGDYHIITDSIKTPLQLLNIEKIDKFMIEEGERQ